jgi:hypothetical protein
MQGKEKHFLINTHPVKKDVRPSSAGIPPGAIQPSARIINKKNGFLHQETVSLWCRRWESNPHSIKEHDFESCASANSATSA